MVVWVVGVRQQGGKKLCRTLSVVLVSLAESSDHFGHLSGELVEVSNPKALATDPLLRGLQLSIIVRDLHLVLHLAAW